MPQIYLGIGSNVEPEKNIHQGVHALQESFGELVLSPVYQSPAYGFDGDDFYNLVTACVTDLGVSLLIEQLKKIENECGRAVRTERYGSRTLDIDVLLYGDLISPELDIPSNDINRYPFVLKPLADIAPDLLYPGTQKTIAACWQERAGQWSSILSEVSLYPGS